MIEKITDATKQAILRKTPYAHGTRPSEEGMPAQQVKRLFYAAIGDESNSVLAEMERMRIEANTSLNGKTDKAMQVQDIESHLDDTHYPSALAVQRYIDKTANLRRLYFSDLEVPSTAWQTLNTAIGSFAYYAQIDLPAVEQTMVPDVYFSPDDIARPQIATFAHCVQGGLRIYATQALQDSVYIDLLVCSLPSYYSALIQADHAQVSVRDAAGKTYADGDPIAVGTSLTVLVAPSDGYALSQVFVNGTLYDGDTVRATFTVERTLHVKAQAVLAEVEQ